MLVRPFIQSIPAFDVVNSTGTATVCILGGDTITTILYEIYDGTTSVYNGQQVVNDSGGDNIRSFNITLSSSMGLVNDKSYTIRAYTRKIVGGVTQEASGYSSVQYFSCYVTPTITLKDSSNVTIGTNYQFTSQSGIISVAFDKISANSPAILNDIQVDIYGVNVNGQDLVYSSGMTYTPFEINFDNLTPTGNDYLYLSYTLKFVAHTTQGMEINQTFTSLTCSYAITSSVDIISVQNDCQNGRIVVKISAIKTMDTTAYNCVDGNKQYVCFSRFPGEVDIFNPRMTLLKSVTTPFNIDSQSAYIIDKISIGGGFIYCFAQGAYDNYTYNPRVSIINISTGMASQLIYGGFTKNIGFKWGITSDENCLYLGNSYFEFATLNPYSQTFSNVVEAPHAIYAMTNDDIYVYCIGGSANKFSLYNKSTKTFSTPINTPFTTSSSATCVATDSNNVYCGGEDGLVIYNKATSSFGEIISIPDNYVARSISVLGDGNIAIGCSLLDSARIYTYSQAMGGISLVYENLNASLADWRASSFFGENLFYFTGTSTGNDSIQISFESITIKRKEATPTGVSNFATLTTISPYLFLLGANEIMFYDYFAKTDAIYQYEAIRSGGNQIETVDVLSQFNGAFIADGTNAYDIEEEWEIGNSSRIQKSVLYEPYGRQYPVVAYNAVTNYRSGTYTAILRSQSNKSNKENNYIDRVSQTKLVKEFNDFLTNRKPKVIKDFNGDIIIVNILNAIPNNYYKELGNAIATTSFDWVEIGGFNENDFQRLGITNSFTLYPIS